MITLDQYLMGRDKTYDCPDEVKRNAAELIERCNRLIAHAPLDMVFIPSSGWRPAEINAKTKGASATSNHISGKAVDWKDPHGEIDAWCTANLDKLEECGIYLESPSSTHGWSHWQSVPPKSGKRVFYP